MIDGSEKRNRQLAFELQNSHVCEKRSNSPLRAVCCRLSCSQVIYAFVISISFFFEGIS